MTTEGQLEPGSVSRRSVLKGMGLAGAAAVVGGTLARSALRAGFGSLDVAARPSPAAAGAADTISLPVPTGSGVWTAPFTPQFAVKGVHAILLFTGKVLLVESTKAYLWDPGTGAGQQVNPPRDIFCAGHTVLGNGEVLVVGGRNVKAGLGPRYTHTFDPSSATWTRRADMGQGRWYPTATTLPDGRAVITAGQNETGKINADVEVYDSGSISKISTRSLLIYPNEFVLPNGKVLIAARNKNVFSLDPATGASAALVKMREAHAAGPAVLLPGGPNGSSRVMICGGKNGTSAASRTVESFDASNPTVPWALRAPLPGPRVQMNLVILPDGRLLGVGGTDGSVGQHEALLYDPATDTWTTMASQTEERGYHSTALLLPDGRVLSAGDNLPPGGGTRLEVYSPPYLSQGSRPAIISSPATANWGSTFSVVTPDIVARAVLIRPGTSTHTIDTDQRHVELVFTTSPGGISVTAPPSPEVAPPGYYMLFLLDGAGVPSVANWIRLA